MFVHQAVLFANLSRCCLLHFLSSEVWWFEGKAMKWVGRCPASPAIGNCLMSYFVPKFLCCHDLEHDEVWLFKLMSLTNCRSFCWVPAGWCCCGHLLFQCRHFASSHRRDQMVIFGDSFLVAALHVIEQLEATVTVPLRDTIALPIFYAAIYCSSLLAKLYWDLTTINVLSHRDGLSTCTTVLNQLCCSI